jgi:Tfp pilus assembly protein PilF
MRAVIGRFLLLITMLLFVGCSFSPKQGSPAPVTKLESSSSTSAPVNLKQILSLLETGKPDTAKAGLEAFLAQNPNHKLANKLYAQLTEDPIKHYGTRHITYQVKSGDTLGELALRYMGDAME